MNEATRRELEAALEEADIPVLLMVLVHLTGDRRWLREPFLPERDTRIFADESGGLAPELRAQVRAAALEALIERDPAGVPLDDALLGEMMSVCVGEPVAPEYLPLALEEMGLRRPPVPPPLPRAAREDLEVIIIGAGVSGICAAIGLKEMGVPFVVLEKNPSVGGTWFENTYPEAGVDTPNHFYSYSFAPNPGWSAYFSKQAEILEYVQGCVDRFGIREHIIPGAEVREARYDEAAQHWTVSHTGPGGAEQTRTARVVITAVGQVNRPKMPAIEGLDRFAGPLFHTARWPAELDLSGKRVAMIGTGASAVQLARSVAGQARSLTIYQRSPQWLMPNADYHRSVSPGKQYLLRSVPFYAAWYRFGLFWRYADGLYESILVDPDWPEPDRAVNATNDRYRGYLTRYMTEKLEGRPDLLAKALPTYPAYGKRMVVDNDWFTTLRRDNVELVSEAVTEITEQGVRAADGIEREADVVVLATGFEATRMLWPMEILGRGGVSIHEAWREDEPSTYLGMTTPGFPNFFMLLGPTTALAHGGSVLFQVEAQVRYLRFLLHHMVTAGIGAVECTREASDDYTARADAAHRRLVFSHPGMDNWYKNRAGRIVTVSPWRLVDYWEMTREPDLRHFAAEPAGRAPAGVASSTG